MKTVIINNSYFLKVAKGNMDFKGFTLKEGSLYGTCNGKYIASSGWTDYEAIRLYELVEAEGKWIDMGWKNIISFSNIEYDDVFDFEYSYVYNVSIEISKKDLDSLYDYNEELYYLLDNSDRKVV